MTILITGGAGFVGANLAKYFNELGEEVIVFDNLVRRGSELNLKEFKKRGIYFHHGDVRNKEDFKSLPKVDVILETAAQPSAIDGYDNPTFDITNNTMGCMNALEKAREDNAIFIFWSTNKVYSANLINQFKRIEKKTRWKWDIDKEFGGISDDFPIDGGQHSIYGLSKVMADLMVQEWYDAYGVRTVVNRFSCLAGEGQFGKSAQGWVAWWMIAAMFDLPLKYIGWGGKQVRDVLFIEDICRLIKMQIDSINTIQGEVFNIGGGKDNTLSLMEATALMEKRFDKKIEVEYIREPRKADHCIYISDISKIWDAISWEPTIDITTGYDRIHEWIKENEKELRELYT